MQSEHLMIVGACRLLKLALIFMTLILHDHVQNYKTEKMRGFDGCIVKTFQNS